MMESPNNENTPMLESMPEDVIIYTFNQFTSIKLQISSLRVSKRLNHILKKSIKLYPLQLRIKTVNDDKFTNYFSSIERNCSVSMDRMTKLYQYDPSTQQNNQNMLYNHLIHIMFQSGGREVGAKYDPFPNDVLPQSVTSINITVPYITYLLSTKIKQQLRFLFIASLECLAYDDHFSMTNDDQNRKIRAREQKEFNQYIQYQFTNLVLLSLTTWFYCENIDIIIPTHIQSLFLWRFDQNHKLTLHFDENKINSNSYNLREVKIEIPICFDEENSKLLTVPHWYKNMELLSKMNSIFIFELHVIIQKEVYSNWSELFVFNEDYHKQLSVMVNRLNYETGDRIIHEAKKDMKEENYTAFLDVLRSKYFPKAKVMKSENIKINKRNFGAILNLYNDHDWMVRDRLENNSKNLSFSSL